MDRCAHDVETRNRLEMAMALLDPRSRRLIELWLEGLSRQEIVTEMQLGEETTSAVFDTALQHLRVLLAR